MSALHDAALDYAARGWAVFPLKERDKVPAVAGGFKVATTDEEEIDAAWEHRPALNVGIATGSMSGGLIVIDLDVHEERGEDGTDALWEWEREHGELPETVSAKTGSGGVHLYYQANTPISSSVNTTLGVDVRAEGGYVVAPPSLHPSGQPYAWDNSPDDFDVAPADDRVLEFVKFVQGGDLKRKVKFKLPKEIKEGGRNTTLHKYGSSMQSRGFSDAEIYGVSAELDPEFSIDLKKGETFSILPHGGPATVTEAKGTEYPLDDLTLTPTDTRGVSNLAVADRVSFRVTRGRVFFIRDLYFR